MNKIKNKLLIMSGKGGVGKTTIAVNLAYALSERGFNVGLLDVDIHGPNVPKMLHLENKELITKNNKLTPTKINSNLKVMSMAFLLDKEKAVIWRGPIKHNLIRQFVEDVDWGDLHYLVIDFPPGTGDEAISISQLLRDNIYSIIVSTPQQVALLDVAKAIDFSKEVDIPIVGLIENMTGEIFGEKGVEDFAQKRNLNFLGSLKLDKKITESSDNGKPFVINKDSDITKSFDKIVEKVISFCKARN